MMTEGYATLPYMIKYYGRIENGSVVDGQYGSQIPFNFLFITYTSMGTTASGYKTQINDWLSNMPKGKQIQANWLVRTLS